MVVLVALMLASVQCGYILHSERRGTKGGDIDLPILIMDCCWFFVGVIPGALALIIDFTSGCIYEPSGSKKVSLRPDSRLSFRLNDPAPADATVAVTLEDPTGLQVKATLMEKNVAQGERIGKVNLALPAGLQPGAYKLALKVNGETSVSWDISL
ncbi:MAG: hypothetical protein A2V67_16050 [Deltaproteobacteria bacterium RBG_13_61_14]|nr:MAG: hypothetical protein A2V67_16050 [Deltaproteobacteria bacterium RBG_13_61_14]